MALFDFLFKRKKDEPQPAAEDRPSENPPVKEAAESAETPEPPSEPAPPAEPSPQADTAEADTVEKFVTLDYYLSDETLPLIAGFARQYAEQILGGMKNWHSKVEIS